MANYLLDLGLNPDALDSVGNTRLHNIWASEEPNKSIEAVLLASLSNEEDKDEDEEAEGEGKIRRVAHINAKNKQGQPATRYWLNQAPVHWNYAEKRRIAEKQYQALIVRGLKEERDYNDNRRNIANTNTTNDNNSPNSNSTKTDEKKRQGKVRAKAEARAKARAEAEAKEKAKRNEAEEGREEDLSTHIPWTEEGKKIIAAITPEEVEYVEKFGSVGPDMCNEYPYIFIYLYSYYPSRNSSFTPIIIYLAFACFILYIYILSFYISHQRSC